MTFKYKNYAPAKQVNQARRLRVNSTEVEKRLWYYIRDCQVDGYKFRRQHSVQQYILDFACEQAKLAIELDGGQHNAPDKLQSDARRTEELEQLGWEVLRFWNNEVIENMEGVVETIRVALTRRCRADLSRGER